MGDQIVEQERQEAATEQYETVFTNAKAGMEGVDKQKVKQVIYDLSKNSAHFKNEQRKQRQINQRIVQMKELLKNSSQAERDQCHLFADQILSHCEINFERTWIHVDMDAFFASVEERDQPHLKKLPMAVGGMGMISTANYIARKFGVRSAMPGFIAKKLCPELVFVSPNFEKYTAASAETRQIFQIYDPEFEAGSLDEAYLDVTEFCQQNSTTPEQVAVELRDTVFAKTGLTCSVGIACNCMLAKICSDINKPNGQYLLSPDQPTVASFMENLPTRKVPNIGKVTEQLLREVLGISTCGELLNQRGNVVLIFTQATAQFFLMAACGIGRTQHEEASQEGQKGMSVERTFRPIREAQDLEIKARELCSRLSQDLQAKKLFGRTVTVKLKLSTFEVRTRSHTLQSYINLEEEIFQVAWRLIKAELPIEIRLMGVRMSSFEHADKRQLTLDQFFQKQTQKNHQNIQQNEQRYISENPQMVDGDCEDQVVIQRCQASKENDGVQLQDDDIEISGYNNFELNIDRTNYDEFQQEHNSFERQRVEICSSNNKSSKIQQFCESEQNYISNDNNCGFLGNLRPENFESYGIFNQTQQSPISQQNFCSNKDISVLKSSNQELNILLQCHVPDKCYFQNQNDSIILSRNLDLSNCDKQQIYLQQNGCQNLVNTNVDLHHRLARESSSLVSFWRCRFCTYCENKMGSDKCEVCEMARVVKRRRCGQQSIFDYFDQNYI